MNKQPFHPDMIAEQRRLLQQGIEKKEEDIKANLEELFAPPPPGRNFFERAVQHAETIYNVVDGVLVGYKLIRGFNFFFKRGKRKSAKR